MRNVATSGGPTHLPTELQRQFWNTWNTTQREQQPMDAPSSMRAAFVLSMVEQHVPRHARLVDLGCGTGWLSEQIAARVTHVTAVDLADEVIARARARSPHVNFRAGDVMTTPTDRDYDAVVSVEVFSHVPDQPAFVDRMADLLKPDGLLILTTQNYTAFSRYSRVMAQGEGQIRRWVTPRELRRLVTPRFHVLQLRTVLPLGDRGVLRLLNGRKACFLWNSLAGAERWQRLRESVGLGQTITLLARRR
jgi:ubiquinone biosynthesis O-methyltransferase